MLKRVMIVALLGVSLVSAKTYSFSLREPVLAGKVQLKPGDYNLKLEGSQVQLTDKTGHHIDATAKVETGDRKFEQTSVSVSKENGAERIQSVALGGSKMKVVFE